MSPTIFKEFFTNPKDFQRPFAGDSIYSIQVRSTCPGKLVVDRKFNLKIDCMLIPRDDGKGYTPLWDHSSVRVNKPGPGIGSFLITFVLCFVLALLAPRPDTLEADGAPAVSHIAHIGDVTAVPTRNRKSTTIYL
ncbi:hypothetical protein H0H93_005041 [Arthromyces matolae]|nr:hypothetical protein H0H93_005041 [Arthromyces matolae]